MLKIYGVGRGRGKKEEEASGAPGVRKRQPGELRVQKEMDELELPSAVTIDFINKDDLMHFTISLTPAEGYWEGATYRFSFSIPGSYPHDAPKVKCETKVYHPNIDLSGNVCLNILREDWKPVLSISAIVDGLLFLFLEPNPSDPLNQEAATLLREDSRSFGRQVQKSLRGQPIGDEAFPRLLK